MTITDAIYLTLIACIPLAAALLFARMLRRDRAKREADIAGIRARLWADHGIQATYTHVQAAIGRADGAVKPAPSSDGSLREVLLRGTGTDLVAYARNGQIWERLPSQDKAEAL